MSWSIAIGASGPTTQQELLDAFVQDAADAIYTKDLEGRYLTINPAGARMLGKTVEEIVGRDDFVLFPYEDANLISQKDRDVLSAQKTVSYEMERQGPAGREVWLTTKGVLRSAEGRVFGLWGISRDITARKQMEQALAVSEQRLRLCLEAGQLATWDWDIAHGNITWSSNVQQVLSVPVEQQPASYDTFIKLVEPSFRDPVIRMLSNAMHQHGDQEVEFRLARPAESPRWLRAKGRSVWQDEKAVRVVGVLMDITAQKLAEDEAKRVSEFQDQLVAIVGHDIRSPIAAITGMTYVLKESTHQEVPGIADRIARSAARVDRITDLLMDFTRSRLGGGIPLQFQRMDAHELVTSIVDEARAANPKRSIELEISGTGEGAWDPDRLGQVLSNLIDNALKYGPPELPVLVSSMGVSRWVVIKVRNGGAPIPPELLPYVFDPFRRGPQTKLTVRRSLGLGLYIVREIVESHGGTIEVTSTAQEGTTFLVNLPKLALEALV